MPAPVAFKAWVLSMLVSAVPIAKRAPEPAIEVQARYEEIAWSVADAAWDAPAPIVPGRMPRSRSMALMASVAVIESGLKLEIDNGTVRGALGECTVFQLMPHDPGDCDRWLNDRRAAAERAHDLMRRSAAACLKVRGGSLDVMLAAYASGSCDAGYAESRARVDYSSRLFRSHPPPKPAAWMF